jgi:hypothetical protein
VILIITHVSTGKIHQNLCYGLGTIYLAPGHRLEKAIYLIDQGKARDTKGLINYCTQWSLLPTSLDFDLHIFKLSILSFTPYPLFQWYPQSKEIFIKSQYEMLKLSI